MIKTSLHVEAVTLWIVFLSNKTQWGHWPTSPTCPCGVWESQEVPLFNAMWFEDDALFCIFVCFSGYAQVLILRWMWMVYGNCNDSHWFTMKHHAAGGSKQLKRYKRQSLKADAWTAKEFKKTTFCWVISFEDPSLQTPFPGLFA